MIKLSKKGDYSLKAMVYIAEKKPKLLKIQDISNDLNISESLLRRIISELDKYGILNNIKGRKGGIQIGMELSKITVFDILKAVGEELGITNCTKGIKCDNIANCGTTNLLSNLQKSFNGILKLQTLDKIIKKTNS